MPPGTMGQQHWSGRGNQGALLKESKSSRKKTNNNLHSNKIQNRSRVGSRSQSQDLGVGDWRGAVLVLQ